MSELRIAGNLSVNWNLQSLFIGGKVSEFFDKESKGLVNSYSNTFYKLFDIIDPRDASTYDSVNAKVASILSKGSLQFYGKHSPVCFFVTDEVSLSDKERAVLVRRINMAHGDKDMLILLDSPSGLTILYTPNKYIDDIGLAGIVRYASNVVSKRNYKRSIANAIVKFKKGVSKLLSIIYY